MGFCFSCCRRRRDKSDRHADLERQHLLSSNTANNDSGSGHPETRSPAAKIADVLAALQTGKLPTQQQLDAGLRKLLRSDFLQVEESGRNDGVFDESLNKIVLDARETVQALLRIGLEKNDDNRLQDLIYQLRELSAWALPVSVETPFDVSIGGDSVNKVQTAASALAEDTLAIISSLRALATLLLSSSAFRLIIGDFLLTARHLVADSAAQVRRTAQAVEHVSDAIEANVRPDSGSNTAQPIKTDVRPTELSDPDPPDSEKQRSPKEVVLDRVEDIFRRAQASPAYNSSLRTLLYIFRKYVERVKLASSAISDAAHNESGETSIQLISPVIVPDPRFSRALEDLKVVLERFAGGKGLEPLLRSLFKVVHDVSLVHANGDEDDAQIFFREIGLWLDAALSNPSFVNSRAGRDTASQLYDKGSSLLSQDARLSENIHHLLGEANAFAEAMKSDRTTNKLLRPIDNLHSDVTTLLGRAADQGKRATTHWGTSLVRLFLGWVLPRILRVIRVIPMPRVEYISTASNGSQTAIAIDTLLLSAEEALVPDVLSVQEFAEVRVEVDEDFGAVELTNPNKRLVSGRKRVEHDQENPLHISIPEDDSENFETNPITSLKKQRKNTNVSTASRIRIHLEGLRLAAHDVGYYVSYVRNSWLGYTDEGLLTIEIGRSGHRQHRGKGLALDIELEMDSDSEAPDKSREGEEGKLFRVVDIRSSIPGFAIHIKHSRHWILNSLLAPLAGPIGRAVIPPILNAQVKSAIESVEKVLREMKSRTDEKAENRIKGNQGTESEAETRMSDWWDALLEVFASEEDKDSDTHPNSNSNSNSNSDSNSDSEPGEREVYTETYTETTLTGITYTTLSQPEPSCQGSPHLPAENTISIGLGSQLLPGKGEPTESGVERESPGEVVQEVANGAREAAEDVQGKVKNVREGVEGAGRKGVEEAMRVRKLAEEASERVGRQERRERRVGGWKSRAFDL